MTDATITRIKHLMRRQTPITEVFTITPEIAEVLLEFNWEGNRAITQGTVNRYANEMRHGHWMLTGEPIIVSRDGRIIDGQHRLWAGLESSVPFEATMTFGIDPEAYRNINCGRVRGIAYRAGLTPNVSSALNVLLRIAYGPDELSQSNLRVFDTLYGEPVRKLVALQARKFPALRRGATVAAAAIWCKAGAEDYVLRQYQLMMALDGGALTPVCRSFLKQMLDSSQKLRGANNPLFVRAFKTFDPDNARIQKLQFRDLSVSLDEARQMILSQMSKAGITLDAKVVMRGHKRRTPAQKAAQEARM